MLKAGLFGTIGAVIAATIVFFIGDAVSGPLMVTPPGSDAPEELIVGAVISATVIGGIAGLGLAALCRRLLGSPATAFVGICIVGLVAYGIFSFTAGENIAEGVWLNVMHIAAAIPIVGLLTQQLQTTQTS